MFEEIGFEDVGFETGSSGTGGGGRSVTVTLVNRNGIPQPNLISLKWAWFDQVTPDTLLAPTDQGTLETTDAVASLVIPLPNTALPAGGVGTLIVSDTNGSPTQSPPHKAFYGPCTVG